MRDVDCDYRCKLLVRAESGIGSTDDLPGKTLVLGSREAAEAVVLPLYFLRKEGIAVNRVKLLQLDKEVDLRGNPCSSPVHVLKALSQGRADAGIIGERLWNDLVARHASEAAGLKAVWTSPPFSHCVFTAAKDFDKDLADRFKRLMLAMDDKDEAAAEVLRLEGAQKWVVGSPVGFEPLLKALQAEAAPRRSQAKPQLP
jgi:ABC-type phosphate/phosphonate transport system substrate-binding protein